MRRFARYARVAATALIVAAAHPCLAQWSNALPLSPGQGDIVDLMASTGGGFHAVYRSPNHVDYRRYNGSLGAVVGIFTAGFTSGAAVTESRNGDVHVVFENWVGATTPQVGWARSINGGASFSGVVNISATSPGCAKWPMLTPYGTGASANVLMTYFRSGTTGGCNKDVYYSLFNGSAWSAEAATGFKSNSEYDCLGQAWSPVDGTVYRTFDPDMSSMKMRRYNGSWGSDTSMISGTWPVRQHVAINGAGQVMVVYDDNGNIYSQLYTPNNGPGAVTQVATGGYSGSCDVAWIPGTNQFYLVIGKAGGAYRVTGYRFAGGVWGPVETVMIGLADAFLAYPSVAVSPVTKEIYCAWQYQPSTPQIYYSIRTAFVAGQTGTLTGTVVNQSAQAQIGVAVDAIGGESAVTDAAGHYSMTLPVGTYTVNATKNSVGGATATNVQITANNTAVRDFTISVIPPNPVTAFVVVSSPTTVNNLRWTNPTSAQFAGTLIRFRTDGQFPTGPADGQLAGDFPDAPGSVHNFSHTGLTNGYTYRYTAFTHDNNASPAYSAGVNAQGTPAVAADFDRDGDVDQSDFSHLQACLTGTDVPTTDPLCLDANLDQSADTDVESADVGIFLNCLGGAGVYANPNCVP